MRSNEPPRETRGAWLVATISMAVLFAVALTIQADQWLVAAGLETISRRLLSLGQRWPWTAFLVAFVAMLPFGALAGHLWWGRTGPFAPLAWGLAGACAALGIGAVFGRQWFGQN